MGPNPGRGDPDRCRGKTMGEEEESQLQEQESALKRNQPC